MCLSAVSQHNSTMVADKISSSVSWLKLRNKLKALNRGPHGTNALHVSYHSFARPSFGNIRACALSAD